MATAGTLAVKLIADLGGWSSNLSKAEKQLVKTANNMEQLGKKLTLGVTAPLIALSGLLAKSAAEDAASVQKMTRVFGKSTKEMEGYIQSLMKTVPETDDALREMASGVKVLSNSLGFGEKSAVGMSKTVLSLAGDLAAFNHTSTGEAVDALEKSLTGKTKGLLAYGVAIDEADIKQEAYKLGLAKTGETLDSVAKAEATLMLVHDRMGKQLGEAGRIAGNASEGYKFFKQALDGLSDTLGTKVLPTLGGALQGVTHLINSFSNLSSGSQTAIVALGAVAAGIGPLIGLAGALTRAFVVLRAAAFAMSEGAGLAGLAALVTPGGIFLIGLAAVATAVWAINRAMNSGKQSADEYRASLKGISDLDLKGKNLSLQGQFDAAGKEKASRQKELRYVQSLPAAQDPEQQKARTTRIQFLSDRIFEADRAQGSASRQMMLLGGEAGSRGSFGGTDSGGDHGNGGGAGTGKGKTAYEQFIDRVNTALGINETTLGKSTAASEVLIGSYEDINGRLKKMGDVVSPVRDELEKLAKSIREADTFMGKYMDSNNADMLKATGKTPTISVTGSASGSGKMALVPDSVVKDLPKGVSAQTAAMNLNTLKMDALRETMATAGDQLLSGMMSLASSLIPNTAGGKIGAGALGAVGAGIGKYLGGTLGKGIGGAIGSAVFPVIGTAIGSIAGGFLGNALGGLFGSHKKKVDKSAASLDKLSQTADKVAESLSNIPTGFKVNGYRYNASNPENNGYTAPGPGPGRNGPQKPDGDPTQGPIDDGTGTTGTGGTGRLGRPTAGDLVVTGGIHVYGVTDVASFYEELGKVATQQAKRGGVSSLSLALNRA